MSAILTTIGTKTVIKTGDFKDHMEAIRYINAKKVRLERIDIPRFYADMISPELKP